MNFMLTGSYIDNDSLIHKANPFLKLLSFLLLLIAVIMSDSFWGYILICLTLMILIELSQIGFKIALKGIYHMWGFYLIIFLMNAAFFETKTPIWSWWIFCFSIEGIVQGINVIFHVALALVLANILMSTTSPLDMIGAIKCCIYPLKYIGVPIKDVAMILGVSIQFVPTFLEEAEMIKNAQTARGARFESKKLTERIQCVIPLVVPIFLSSFRRADELAIAMEARGYRKTKRNIKFEKQHISKIDIIFILISCFLCIAEYFI